MSAKSEAARMLIETPDARDGRSLLNAAEAQVYATLALVEAQERTAKALELIAGPKGILGVEKS